MEFFSIDDHLAKSYTRSQAMADGMLVDISEAAAEAGFRVPVAMTSSALRWSASKCSPTFAIARS
jgi:hypothetical protein